MGTIKICDQSVCHVKTNLYQSSQLKTSCTLHSVLFLKAFTDILQVLIWYRLSPSTTPSSLWITWSTCSSTTLHTADTREKFHLMASTWYNILTFRRHILIFWRLHSANWNVLIIILVSGCKLLLSFCRSSTVKRLPFLVRGIPTTSHGPQLELNTWLNQLESSCQKRRLELTSLLVFTYSENTHCRGKYHYIRLISSLTRLDSAKQ